MSKPLHFSANQLLAVPKKRVYKPRAKPVPKRATTNDVLPLTPAIRAAYAELAKFTPAELEAERVCTVCQQGVGLPKAIVSAKLCLCLVCFSLLAAQPQEVRVRVVKAAQEERLDLEKYLLQRLPYLRNWLCLENRLKRPIDKDVPNE